MSRSIVTSTLIFPDAASNQHSSTTILSTTTVGDDSSRRALKRRRDETATTEAWLEPFEIRPLHPSTSTAGAIIAYPCYLLSRARLPLSFLAACSETKTCLPRVFSSSIPILEPQEHYVQEEPKVLIIKIENERSLYAVERVARNIYSSSNLASWVSLEQLQDLPSLKAKQCHRRPPTPTIGLAARKEWWSSLVTRPLGASHVNKKIKIEPDDDVTIAFGNASDPVQEDIPLAQVHSDGTAPALLPAASVITDLGDAVNNVQPSLEDSCHNVHMQYLEMLYVTKAPLAYFAKGSLARARVALSPTDGSTGGLQNLIDSLRLMVLSTSLLDKRYKESIPAAVRSSHAALLDTESTKTPKRKKTRKFKPGKDALFPDESDLIKQWWSGDVNDSIVPPTATSLEAAMKIRIASLRLREYLLQMVLMLEILALEASLAKLASTRNDTQSDVHATEGQEARELHGRTVKKPRDLQALIDTIVDRITIWQSVTSVESADTRDSQDQEHEGIDAATAATGKMKDDLKEFCLEVVIPFYASRVGEVAERIAPKLGVQTVPSPSKRRSAHKEPAVRPGAALSRESKSKARRPTNRAPASNRRSETGRPPSLMRSATDTLLQEIQRERSNSPNISLIGGNRSFSRSNSINHSKRINQKEVDLDAQAKLGQQEKVKNELQSAIATLKKPNRGLAVKEFVDASDTRKLASQKRGAPSRTQSQVGATPRRKRTKDVVAATPSRRDAGTFATEEAIPSSAGFIPSSGYRPSESRATGVKAALVFETPSKPGGRYTDALGIVNSTVDDDSATDLRDVPAQPVFKRPVLPRAPSSSETMPGIVMHTPQKAERSSQAQPFGPLRGDQEMIEAVLSSPVAVRKVVHQTPAQQPEQSIYDSLGWDNDDIL